MSSESSPSIEDRCCTQDWLENIIEGYYSTRQPDNELQLEVLEWDIKPIEGEGYLSELLGLDVRYSVDGEDKRERLVAKLLPPDPCSRAFVKQMQFDLREIKLYTEIAPAMENMMRRQLPPEDMQPLSIPAIFHAAYKQEAESILVMEDLRAKGFLHRNLNKGLTTRQAEVAAESIAQIHAASFAIEVKGKEDLESRYPYLLTRERGEEAFHSLFEKGLPLFLRYLQNKPDSQSIRTCLQDYSGNRSRNIFRRILTPSEKLNTIVHCDFWSNNIMFKSSGDSGNDIQCRIIDWQTFMKAKPSIDLGMLIMTSLSPEVRRDHEEAIVVTYWNAFTKYLRQLGIKDKDHNYSFEDLKKDLRDGKLYAGLIMVGSVDIALGDPVREDRVLSVVKDLMKDDILIL